ncbi:MAG: hypothetical protein QW838_05910 [Candidatus Nitrosotenuis sp.]
MEPEGDYRYWYASLPISQLRRIDYTARYIPAAARRYRYLWAMSGAVVGMAAMTLLLTWLLYGLIVLGAILGALPGILLGGLPGWWLGRVMGPQPVWVVKRQRPTETSPGSLVPVIPRALLQQREFALRADFLHDIRQQRGVVRLFSIRASKRYQKLQMTSLIVLAGALAVLIVFFVLLRQEQPSTPPPQAQTQEQRP